MAPTQSIIDQGAQNTIPIRRDLHQLLASLTIQVLDKEAERTDINKRINSEIKKLKKQQRDAANEIRAGGRQMSLDESGDEGDEQ